MYSSGPGKWFDRRRHVEASFLECASDHVFLLPGWPAVDPAASPRRGGVGLLEMIDLKLLQPMIGLAVMQEDEGVAGPSYG
jgi:hypothetical protein